MQVTPAITAWAVRTAFILPSTAGLPVIAGVTGGFAPSFIGRSRAFVYVVRRGDTVGKLALRYGVSITSIVRSNRLSNANLIYVGQRLFIP